MSWQPSLGMPCRRARLLGAAGAQRRAASGGTDSPVMNFLGNQPLPPFSHLCEASRKSVPGGGVYLLSTLNFRRNQANIPLQQNKFFNFSSGMEYGGGVAWVIKKLTMGMAGNARKRSGTPIPKPCTARCPLLDVKQVARERVLAWFPSKIIAYKRFKYV